MPESFRFVYFGKEPRLDDLKQYPATKKNSGMWNAYMNLHKNPTAVRETPECPITIKIMANPLAIEICVSRASRNVTPLLLTVLFLKSRICINFKAIAGMLFAAEGELDGAPD